MEGLGKTVALFRNLLTPAQCLYMWVTGQLRRSENQTLGYVLTCFPPLYEALMRMREEFHKGRIPCKHLLYWKIGLLQLIELPLCLVSNMIDEMQVFSPICRGTEPWRGEAAPAGR